MAKGIPKVQAAVSQFRSMSLKYYATLADPYWREVIADHLAVWIEASPARARTIVNVVSPTLERLQTLGLETSCAPPSW